jgi:hypothetical protein
MSEKFFCGALAVALFAHSFLAQVQPQAKLSKVGFLEKSGKGS